MDGYGQVIGCLGVRLREILEKMPEGRRRRVREIRLGLGRPVCLVTGEGTEFLLGDGALLNYHTPRAVVASREDLEEAFRRASGYSIQSCEEEINSGFLTLEGGHRVGIAGTASAENGKILALKSVSSLNFRIARCVSGAAGNLPGQLYRMGRLPSVLITGEPGSGKTTLLRDLIRRLSSGETGKYLRIAVVDERCELGGARDGQASFDLGPCTDLLCGYPKGVGMSIALRTLSPDILVCDEIGGEEEAFAVTQSVNAGVALLCSAHAGSSEQLNRRKPLLSLVQSGAFDKLIQLGPRESPCTIKEIAEIGFGRPGTEKAERMEKGRELLEMAGSRTSVGNQYPDRFLA